MKLVLEKIVKEEREVPSINSADKVELTGIRIGDVKGHTLRFSGSKDNELGVFNLFFYDNDNDWEFLLHIDSYGISFKRLLYRPNHDHSDTETLAVRVDDSVPGPKKGTIQWLRSYDSTWEPYYVPFGAVKVDY